MPDVNPYAYTEEPDFVFSRQQGSQTGEPALPLNMSLVHKTGVFSSRLCEMSVTEDQIEISGMHLEESVTIQRLTARDRVKLRLLDMKIRDDNGRKHRMKYPKADPEKYLTLARLETWLNPDLTDDPEAARRQVDNRLKKWTCSMVCNSLIALLVLQVMGLVLVVSFMRLTNNPGGETEEAMIIMSLLLGGFAVSHFIVLALLRFGRMRVLWIVIIFYSLFFLSSLLSLTSLNIIGVFGALICGAIIYYSVKAMSDYKRLSPRIGGIME